MPLYRHPDSKNWWVRLSVAGHKTRRSTGTDDRLQAEEFEQRERERLWRQYKLGDRGAVRWGEVTKRYLADSRRERSRDRQIIQALSFLDDEAVSSLDEDAIHELRQNLLAEGKAPATVDRFMRTVRAILRACVRWRLIERAPPIPMYNAPAPDARWLSPSEFRRLLKELPVHMRPPATFAVQTGLRHDSMLALTWDRVDLKAARAWVPSSQMKAGKSHGIPLNAAAMEVLRKLWRLTGGEGHVFQWRGKPLRNCNTKAFRKAVARAKVGPFRWHDLRHTFASWAVQGGVTLHELMQLGGWASYAMVLRYAHLAPDHLAQAAAKVGAYQGTGPKRAARSRK